MSLHIFFCLVLFFCSCNFPLALFPFILTADPFSFVRFLRSRISNRYISAGAYESVFSRQNQLRPFFFNCQIKRSEIERSIAQTFGEFDFDRSFSAIELNRSIKLDLIRLISITECSTTYVGPHQPPLPSPGLISNQTLQFFLFGMQRVFKCFLKAFSGK